MLDDLPLFWFASLLGFVLGAALGFVARRGRFCTLGAIEDAVYSNDTRRLRSWILAIGVAIIGVHALEAVGRARPDRARSMSVRGSNGARSSSAVFCSASAWRSTAHAASARCASSAAATCKALISFLVIGVTAMMTMRGLTGIARISLTDPLSLQFAAILLAAPAGNGRLARQPTHLCLRSRSVRDRRLRIRASRLPRERCASRSPALLVGVIVVARLVGDRIAGFDSFDTRRIESFTFVGPLGETLLLFHALDRAAAGFPGRRRARRCRRRLHRGEDRRHASDGKHPADANDLKRRLLGAFLMGFGGITALGCTIGQGVTGLSTLSVGSALATVSIFAGARAGLFLLVERKWTFGKLRTTRAVPAKAAVGHERISCTDP